MIKKNEDENSDYTYFCSIVDNLCEFIGEEDIIDMD